MASQRVDVRTGYHLLRGRSAGWANDADTTGLEPHFDHPGDAAKAYQLDFRNIGNQPSLAHRRRTESPELPQYYASAHVLKNDQMCARTSLGGGETVSTPEQNRETPVNQWVSKRGPVTAVVSSL